MTRFVSQMLKLPLTAFVYTMEMFVKTVQGLRKIADQGIDAMMSGVTQNFEGPKNDATLNELTQAAVQTQSSPVDLTAERRSHATSSIVAVQSQINPEEETKMPDNNLSDEMLKLVRYKILFVKRDYEHAFPEVEELVHDNMTAASFSGWKIAQFIQNLGNEETPIPKKWKEDHYPADKYIRGGNLIGFPEDDKKYLRVYFEVLDRYVREEFRYEEDQIDVLKEIRDALKGSQGGSSGSSGYSTAGGAGTAGGGGSVGGGRGTGAGGGGTAGGGRGTP